MAEYGHMVSYIHEDLLAINSFNLAYMEGFTRYETLLADIFGISYSNYESSQIIWVHSDIPVCGM
ncbi:5039_t:CDS:2 [Gigaspora margarita]|uniref:5039_t:CDS:1 n=1 Tax=Gigaspora margarita TaxID=4874 RepID=A0ABN7UES3_GIGMA|nr:5039_t:CDS:2 [Gigaspora margarita]